MLSLLNFFAVFSMFSYGVHVNNLPACIGLQRSALSFMILAAWMSIFKDIRCSSSTNVEHHLEQGKKMLAAGQFADALSHYHLAIEGDPNNYMIYFRRATVYLAMGKSKSAIPDLDQVLVLKPDFNAARVQRANVKLKQGKLDEAEQDYQTVDSSNSEAKSQLQLIPTIRTSIIQSKHLADAGDYNGAIQYLNVAIETCIWDAHLHELRASYYEKVGDIMKAIQDIRPTVKLIPDNTNGYLKLSTMLYSVGEVEDSLKEIRECLKLDADHKGCHDHYKKVKKLNKHMTDVQSAIEKKDWNECISKTNQMFKSESTVQPIVLKAESHYCRCYFEIKDTERASQHCNKVLKMSPNDVDALCYRAEVHILNEKFEEAVNDFKQAEQIYSDHHRVQEGLKRAQKLLKQSKKRDYYKILDVKRTASKGEITKAYRKLAAKWHPDQYDGDDKGHAEKMFIDIAAAKEVLSDPEKRAKFDQGEDPLDPEQQTGGPQWHEGFNPFGHGGFQFKFHFN
ncbi:hypothetical protein HELRODRAFT_185263 [Helobdella robusta]|uniref:J domain-containing protein n=1 Tax=Helobdella robusta TaxID=6412 RepID=T1FMK8_HELRO|nr:hypothetical protein HELRODRAFT_185263 [Helobdella robusta]ESO10656.1 hypothetical protein HELRODRAFT_185263 [Helobdella robusta]